MFQFNSINFSIIMMNMMKVMVDTGNVQPMKHMLLIEIPTMHREWLMAIKISNQFINEDSLKKI